LGVRAALELGLGAQLVGPERGEPAVDWNETRFEALARFRTFFGVRSDAPALLMGTGVRVERTTVTHREPALLVDRLVAGPLAEVAFEYPLLHGDLAARLSALAGLPFFVQEPHRDSGDPNGRLALGARLELWSRLSGRWGLWASADLASTSLAFRGEGTRGLGVRDAKTDDLRLQALAGLRWSLLPRGASADL
jgi:hypothetical protein